MNRPRQKLDLIEALRTLELEEELQADGYRVRRNVRSGNVVFDLTATKKDERLAYEVRALARLKTGAAHLQALRHAARDADYVFRIHVAVPPHERTIEFPGLVESLREYLDDHLPAELEGLAAYTSIDGVVDVDLDAISVEPNVIKVQGSATVEVTVNSGGSGEDAFSVDDSFQFAFTADLDHECDIQDANITVDVSSWYE